ncbi:hypothetical protein KBY75_13065 [Cyanobium sp. T1G-Tous]|uniref:hypothetical protein n=1 Tax=Cyanobium sp. T1G-Tous TaxID=2823722 RepID=UPI0020CF5A59|nr:hypothetical protein [Cyanobium sp. T1G-Tous]MCP9804497.1 hypothetical protein [Cyanobium sp. T1G-Tous]
MCQWPRRQWGRRGALLLLAPLELPGEVALVVRSRRKSLPIHTGPQGLAAPVSSAPPAEKPLPLGILAAGPVVSSSYGRCAAAEP